VVSLRVREVLKGNAPKTYTFRQYIWDIRDRFDTAAYLKGQELLLLMNKPSRFGLTSPTGLEQGRFRIVRVHGVPMAMNGQGNVGLFTNVQAQMTGKRMALSRGASSMLQTRTGAVRADELSEVIRALAGSRR
jgi:hypothetical protein